MKNTSLSYKKINGIDLHFEYDRHPSSSQTIVLIHGFLSSLFSYRHLVPFLKKEFSVVSIDLPPFGKSVHSRRFKYSYKNLAKTVVTLLETLQISDYTIVGHSLGGQIALNILYHFPGRAKNAVLLSSSSYLNKTKNSQVLASYLPFFPFLVKRYLARSGLEKNLQLVVFDQSLIDDEMRQGYMAPFLNNNQIFRGLTHLLRDREGDLLPEALHQIQTPILMIWGRHDRVVPLQVGKRLKKDLIHSQLIILEDTGHLVPEERPEEVFQHMSRFIKTQN